MQSVLASALLTLPLLLVATPVKSAGTDCHDYVLINTRGTGEPQAPSVGFRKMIEAILLEVLGGTSYDTRYLAAPDATQLTTLVGSRDIIELIKEGTQSCPDQKYVLLGYSQGATVTNQVLQHFDTKSNEGDNIKGVVLIGNPYHQPNEVGNLDEDCGSTTAGAMGILNRIADYTIPDTWYTTGKIRDICSTDDQVCNGISASNLFSGTHLLYGFTESVQTCGSDFVINQLSSS
jgi:pimeloyl-ACP methyl ester carboxylesterase